MNAGRVALMAGTAMIARAVCGRPADDRAAVIATLANDALTAWDVPGAAVAVVTRDGVVSLGGYGRRELGGRSPVTPDTVFPLASCSKAFTTTLMAMLADEG